MSINVYWSCLENEWMLASKPDRVSVSFLKNDWSIDKSSPDSMLLKCPTVNDSMKNIYSLKSIYSYNFSINSETITTNAYDQEFFDSHVLVRSIKNKMFSFQQRFIFFTDEDSLITRFNIFPFLEKNNISSRCIMPTGQYDIAKWFRNTDFVFYLKDEYTSFQIDFEEYFSYIEFFTDQKINFKQFVWNNDFNNYINDGFYLNSKFSTSSMKNYYKFFKNKKRILKSINENLID